MEKEGERSVLSRMCYNRRENSPRFPGKILLAWRDKEKRENLGNQHSMAPVPPFVRPCDEGIRSKVTALSLGSLNCAYL